MPYSDTIRNKIAHLNQRIVDLNAQRDLIDMNNTSRQQIEQIWAKVNDDASTALTKFSSTQSDLEDFQQQIKALTATLDGGAATGTLDISYLTGGLKASIDFYNKVSALYGKMENEGLDADSASKDPHALTVMLKVFGNKILKYALKLSVSNEWSKPIGPGLVLSFSVSAADGKGKVTLNVPGSIAKAQKDELLDMISFGVMGNSVQLDKNGHPIDAPEGRGYGRWKTDHDLGLDKGGGGRFSWSRTHGDKTQKYSMNFQQGSIAVSAGVSQDYGKDTSIASELGITASNDSHWTDFRKPEPVRVPAKIPTFSLQWHLEIIPATSPVPAGATIIAVMGAFILIMLAIA
ncbi:hypothetical protein [Bifidobacterium sp. ESL0704]|uniref:hypothetical protein n=1 Tax=Bifidobacterium sp. ESL0704 TaxID=2983219 RepID=UPI0023F88D19|nr:hypothetical protein [Bifidobacterium sp. ESL0704]WEV52974.1 hypothetical protein OZX64_00215 [Bifidobacterium sp. ESL0704]